MVFPQLGCFLGLCVYYTPVQACCQQLSGKVVHQTQFNSRGPNEPPSQVLFATIKVNYLATAQICSTPPRLSQSIPNLAKPHI